MSTTYLIQKRDQLAAQLAEQNRLVQEAMAAERGETIAKIKQIMAEHGITAADLAGVKPAKQARPAKVKKERAGITYLFKGNVYTTGKPGKPPAWFSELKRGGQIHKYEVDPRSPVEYAPSEVQNAA